MLNGDEMKITREQLARMIDHTLLKPDATAEDVKRLCAEAMEHNFASVCVNPIHISLAAKMLEGTNIKVCTVIGFPLGATTSETKVFETKNALTNGAQEVDMVMNIGALKSGDYEAVKQDINTVVEAAGDAIVKIIIETGLLTDEEKIKACQLAMGSGAGFVKTSTGFGIEGATVRDVELMRSVVGKDMGIKASGGIRTYEDAVALVKAGATRIGTSAGVALVSGENYTGRKFETVFVGKNVPHREKHNIIEIGRKLKSMYLTESSLGSLSVKVDDGILITAGEASLGDLKEDYMVLVKGYDPERNIANVIGSKEPSSETPLHHLIYQQLGCRAVIHVHDDSLLARWKELNLPLAKYAPYGTPELAQNALLALQSGNLIAMEKHGILSIGKSLEEALDMIVKKKTS